MIESLLGELDELVADDHEHTCGICDRAITFKHDDDIGEVIAHIQDHKSMHHNGAEVGK